MKQYKPTYSYGITTSNPSNPSRFWTCGYPVPSKKTEANRGGINKINDSIRYGSRNTNKDLINFSLDNNGPIHECPPPVPTPTLTSPYSYTNPITITEIP
jgi:hypothetical protein